MERSFNPFIYGNERNVYGAMLTLPNSGGTVEEITKVYSGFKTDKVSLALEGLVAKGIVVSQESVYMVAESPNR
ncbi:hypothetical protein [Paenibacillus sp. DMB5]|uniref:hypothetical protein n=1 Tax=Paenibacillus sp. DMB5 TaxID=1780103 RepID=UPI00076CCBFC|nr:hypothetical protein [Paenibacillus sp. DMB5]KUP22059.1 hypothetical protein AWJ19_21350 [Paenibacillus sp. DMB5]